MHGSDSNDDSQDTDLVQDEEESELDDDEDEEQDDEYLQRLALEAKKLRVCKECLLCINGNSNTSLHSANHL